MKHLISNIKSVDYADAADLSAALVVKGRGIILNSSPIFKEISINGLASCEISEKISNNEKIFLKKLQFHTCSPFFTALRHYCYRLTTVTGSTFLLGTADRPYALVTNDESMPSATTAKSGVTVTITHESTLPLLAILG